MGCVFRHRHYAYTRGCACARVCRACVCVFGIGLSIPIFMWSTLRAQRGYQASEVFAHAAVFNADFGVEL
jgi:uncharacterized membrane protein